jgi:transposase-like protein
MMRKKFEAGFKAKVALESFKGEKTTAELSSEYGVHANQISKWKQELLKGASGIFNNIVLAPHYTQKFLACLISLFLVYFI